MFSSDRAHFSADLHLSQSNRTKLGRQSVPWKIRSNIFTCLHMPWFDYLHYLPDHCSIWLLPRIDSEAAFSPFIFNPQDQLVSIFCQDSDKVSLSHLAGGSSSSPTLTAPLEVAHLLGRLWILRHWALWCPHVLFELWEYFVWEDVNPTKSPEAGGADPRAHPQVTHTGSCILSTVQVERLDSYCMC